MSAAAEARRLGISRQRLWQIDRKLAGLCPACGGKRTSWRTLCDTCAIKQNIRKKVYMRKRAESGYYKARYVQRKQAGLCVKCAEPLSPDSATHCVKHTNERRERRGHKPWQPGKRGRPPLWWLAAHARSARP